MPYTHYTTDERHVLPAMAGMRLPKSCMSVILGKHHSSIYREFNRNGSGGVYTGTEAQAASEQRRLEHKPSPKTDDEALLRENVALFKKDLLPDQISGRLRVEHPGRPEKLASPSTIYPQLYEETAEDPLLKEHFRQKQAKPRRRSGAQDRRGQIVGRVSIEERPKVVTEQRCVGDWEGDAIESAGKSTSIATVVDRKTKVLLANIMTDKRADTLNRAAVRAFRGIPPEARHTLTLDNGKECAAHDALSQVLSLDIFLSIPIIPGSGASTRSSGSTFRKKYRLTP